MKGSIKYLVYLGPRSQEVGDLAGRCPDQLTHQDQIILGYKRGFSYTQNWHPGSLAFWLGAEHVHSKCSVRCSPDSFLPLTLQWPTRLQSQPHELQTAPPSWTATPHHQLLLNTSDTQSRRLGTSSAFWEVRSKGFHTHFIPPPLILTSDEASGTSCSKE